MQRCGWDGEGMQERGWDGEGMQGCGWESKQCSFQEQVMSSYAQLGVIVSVSIIYWKFAKRFLDALKKHIYVHMYIHTHTLCMR